ncbi:CoA-acylating methylmalonate-semialdehyde dehydrogenase [Pseudomonas sp. GL-B-26]|uniref:CoA-acylating methylmalonate-semialdehyde dehydrogenase n=1 Tax=Pseudomonas sp. GL-B-26 TaxID=2832394 RepID=UPI001CBF459C|nr:CoA-acylating methylmalonate-semialdehyde dehydrogenase [Pseudomonas sp. GL-B-26]
MKISHFIAGQPHAGSGIHTGPVFNPSNGHKLYDLDYGDSDLVDHAVAVAKKAGAEWAKTSQARRLQIIFKMRELVIANTDRIAEITGQENGKTLADAKGEIGRALEALEYATNAAQISKGEYSLNVGGGIDVYSFRQPVGVVGCIAPFNFPVMVPLMMASMAIACGNAVILKPSEKVPGASFLLSELWKEAGLPDGVWNMVNGGKEVVDGILTNPDIPAISFVGSTAIGEYIYQKGSHHGKRVAAYTGGKNHMVVMPDADLEAAASAFVSAAYGSASQRCMAISLLLPVGKQTADKLIELIVPKIKALRMGAYNDPKADFGAVISTVSKEQVLASIDTAIEQGGELIIDGRFGEDSNGFYVGASLIDNVTVEMEMYKKEIFGPVRGIVRVNSLDEAIDVTNHHEYGNGAVIYTRDGNSAHRFTVEVKAGMLGVNVAVPVPVGHHNFGGLRRSKFGDAHMFGPDAARFYSDLKTVSQRWPESGGDSHTLSMAFPSNE